MKQAKLKEHRAKESGHYLLDRPELLPDVTLKEFYFRMNDARERLRKAKKTGNFYTLL